MSLYTDDDHRLLEYNSYDDYLNAFITKEDLRYLGNINYARKIAELGYRSSVKTLSPNEFDRRRAAVQELDATMRKHYKLASAGLGKLAAVPLGGGGGGGGGYNNANKDNIDVVLVELAARERPNRVGILSTIIFVRNFTATGHEKSGYVDYEQSLRQSRGRFEGAVDWPKVFAGERRLWPKRTDLGFYNWHSGESVCNDSDNYKVICSPKRGLIFENVSDRKTICVNPLVVASPGSGTTRTTLTSARYAQVVLFDHIIRT